MTNSNRQTAVKSFINFIEFNSTGPFSWVSPPSILTDPEIKFSWVSAIVCRLCIFLQKLEKKKKEKKPYLLKHEYKPGILPVTLDSILASSEF